MAHAAESDAWLEAHSQTEHETMIALLSGVIVRPPEG